MDPDLRFLEWAVRDSNPRPLARHAVNLDIGGRLRTQSRRSTATEITEGPHRTTTDAVS